MFRSYKVQKKFVAVWSLFSLLFNMMQPAFLALSLAPIITPNTAKAEDATGSAVIDPTPTPDPTVEPSATPVASIEPSANPSAEPSIAPSIEPSADPSISPSSSPDATLEPITSIEPSAEPSIEPAASPTDNPVNPEPSQDSSPAPPASSGVLTQDASPSPSVSPTPTSSPNLNEKLNISLIDHTAAASVEEYDLTITETGSAQLATDKLDYAPTDTAIITGSGFLGNTTYKLVISSTDEPATSTTVDVKTDSDGTLFYAYQLDGNYRPNYKVEAYLGATLVVTITFTDSANPSIVWPTIWTTPNSCITDPTGESGVAPTEVDLTGNNVNPAVGFASDANYYYFRERVNGDPGAVTNLHNYSWVVLFQTSTPQYQYLGSISGKAGNKVLLYDNTTHSPDSGGVDFLPLFNDPADNVVWSGNSSDYGRVTGSGPYYIDWAMPVSELNSRGINVNTSKFFATSTNANNYNKDYLQCYEQFADLSIVKSDSPDPVINGGVLTYTLAIHNAGPDTATSVVVNDTLPTGYSVTSVTPSVGSCSDIVAPSLQCELGNMVSGANATITVVGTITTNLATITNTASVGLDTTASIDLNMANNTDAEDTLVNPQLGTLTINKTAVGGDGAFDYSVAGPSASSKSITTVNGTGTTGSFSVTPGSYTVTETVPSGWSMTNDCVGSFSIANGQNKVCTFTNTKQPSLTVTKSVVNDNGGQLTPSSFPLFVNGNSVTSGATNTYAPGTYTISETQQSGYTQTSLTCTGGKVNPVVLNAGENISCTITNNDIAPQLTVIKHVINDNGGLKAAGDFTMNVTGTNVSDSSFAGAEDPGTTVTLNAGSYSVDETELSGYTKSLGDNCSSTIALGESKTCTITNDDQAATLHVIKVVTNDNGGNKTASDFSFQVNGQTAVNFEADGQNDLTVNAGTYSVTEPSASGYATSYSNCSNLVIPNGGSATCTITNNDIAPILHLRKIVTNDNGGNATVADFTLTADGTGDNDLTGTSPVDSGTTLKADTFALSETTMPGYTATAWDCIGGTQNGSNVTLDLAQEATCTITNNDQQAYITVTKVVTNDNGGNANPDDFMLTLEGNSVTSGVAIPVNPGTYTAGETSLPGYTFEGFSGDCDQNGDVTVALGESKVCTLTNNDQQAYITVVKVVNQDNGGTAAPDDFNLTLEGTPVNSGVAVPVNPGTYTAEETLLKGYSFDGFSGDCDQNGDVTVALGESKTCTLTNSDDALSLTLVKQVINDNGGSAEPSDWTLTATGYDANSPDLGTYNLSESGGPAGYTQTSLTCDNAKGQVTSVTLSLGEHVTCTFVNDDIAPTLTVIKNVQNDNGGNAVVTDFDIELNGNDLSFGAGAVEGDTTTYTSTPTVVSNLEYTLSEIDFAGYNEGTWSCADANTKASISNPFTLSEGQNVICTITNDDIAPTITLNKVVVGGSASSDSFGLTIGDTSVTSGQTLTLNSNTAYALNEAGLSGYSFTSLTGDAKCPAVLGGTVTLDEDEDISCTITNTRDEGSIVVHKIIDADGNLETKDDQFAGNDWTVDVDGTTDDTSDPSSQSTALGSATFSSLKTGSYNVSETQQAGYDLLDAYCDQENGSPDGTTIYSVDLGKNQTVNCTFVNTPNGTLHGYKWHDLNNNHLQDENGTELSGWTINLYKDNGEGYDLIDSMITDGDEHYGWYWFEHLFPGNYKICEVNQAGWLQTYPQTEDGCHLVTLPDDNSNNFAEVQNAVAGPTYNFGNVAYSDLTVTKYSDDNGNGRFDEGEDTLSDWGINLGIGEDLLEETTGEDGEVTFSNLLPGSYVLSEDLVEGWKQTNISCSEREIDNDNAHPLNIAAGSSLSCQIGNQAEPKLRIQKTNDATDNKNPGDIVTYTLKLDLTGSSLKDVVVTDVTPDGFDYVTGSWTADKNGLPLIISEPNYASPGTWNLGDMENGDIITLTYQAKISSNQDGGTYNDIAWAEGSSNGWGDVLALGHDSEYVDGVFVGTDVVIAKSTEQTGSADIEKEGEVLGASTELPSTGAQTGWLLLALSLLITGILMVFGGRRMSKLTLAIFIFLAPFMKSATIAHASDLDNNLSVRIEQPATPTRITDWKLSFSVLDRAMRTPSVTCYVKKPSAGSFVSFDSTHVSSKPQGDNGSCQVNNSVMSDQGTYEFYVTANAGSDSEDSLHVFVNYDTSGPSAPHTYSKEHPSLCRWVIKFHTAADGGATTKVKIYSSDQKNFDTNEGTRVGTIDIGSDQNGSFTHDRADNCEKDWYYVVRAFDSAGNQSDYVGDQFVTITTSTSASPSPASLVVTKPSGNVLGQETSQTEEATGDVLGEKGDSTEVIEATEDGTQSVQEAAKSPVKSKLFWWVLSAIAALGIIYGIAKKNKSA